jgi:hypothetical protein
VSEPELKKVDAQVLAILARARDAENARWNATDPAKKISFTIDTIGIRPANSSQNDNMPIIVAAAKAAKEVGITRMRYGASSTDANYPMSVGIPAITVNGGGDDSGAHSLDEWYDDGADGFLGPQFAAVLIAIIAGLKN